jgi:hypothetical protein
VGELTFDLPNAGKSLGPDHRDLGKLRIRSPLSRSSILIAGGDRMYIAMWWFQRHRTD